MTFLEHRVPPPIVGAVVAGIMWAGHWIVPEATFTLPLRWLWVALVAITAVFIAVTAIRTFVKAETTIDPLEPNAADRLVTHGLFRYSRNPMYVSLTLVLVAVGLFLQNAVAIALVVLFPLYLTRFQIIPEERALAEKFGDEFEAYRRRVRRWL